MSFPRLRPTLAAVVAALSLAAAAQAATTFELDGAHSSVLIAINHLGVSTSHGRFNEISGSLVEDLENPAASRVEVTVQTASFDTRNEKRDTHVKSPDFLDAAQFPVLKFKSTAVKDLGGGALEVTGDLTLHGVTKPVTVTARHVGRGDDPWGGHRSGYDAELTIKRSDYGITFMLPGVGDEVRITLALEGIRK